MSVYFRSPAKTVGFSGTCLYWCVYNQPSWAKLNTAHFRARWLQPGGYMHKEAVHLKPILSRWTCPLLSYSITVAETCCYDLALWHSTFACDVMKLCAKFDRNRLNWASHSRVISIWIFDLMTLNCVIVALCFGIIFTKFELSQPIHTWLIAFFATKIVVGVVFDGTRK